MVSCCVEDFFNVIFKDEDDNMEWRLRILFLFMFVCDIGVCVWIEDVSWFTINRFVVLFVWMLWNIFCFFLLFVLFVKC